MNKINEIISFLDELYPNPKSELNYIKDYELLIAVVLSAQTTDKKVNKVTNILFNKYPDLDSLNKVPIEELETLFIPIGMYRKKAEYIKT